METKVSITTAQRWFQNFNNVFMIILALICVLPLVHVLALSLSASHAVAANKIIFWPIDLNFLSYQKAISNPQFFDSLLISIERTVLSLVLGLIVNCMAAYVLSRGGGRDGIAGYGFFIGFFIIAMLFNAGMIPNYLLIVNIGLYDTVWALVLPGVLNVFFLILIMNFFKTLPKELEEAAFIDGANHWKAFVMIFMPLSLPVLATVGLFLVVHEWNEWFIGSIYMKGDHVPLSTFLKSALNVSAVDSSNASEIANLNIRSLKAAQVLIGALPILLVYPVLQKFFTKGLVIGAVKE